MTDPVIAKRQTIERRIIRKLIHTAITHGWKLWAVHDGEECVPVTTAPQAIDALTAVDESHLIFQNIVGSKLLHASVFFVFGNDGYDVINDWSGTPEFEPVMDIVEEYCGDLEEKA